MTPSDEARKRGLGRGLSSLLGDNELEPIAMPAHAITRLPIDLLLPNPWQPRHVFHPEAMENLIASVKERGVIQPILVRASEEHVGHYQIIAGERRWRAAQAAKLHEIPVVVRQLSDIEALELALIENIQRADLSAIEEAIAYRRLMNEFKHTQEELAKNLGKSRSHIANMLRLLLLPETVQKMVDEGKLTIGHARALINVPDAKTLAEQVIEQGLSVRDTEKLAQLAKTKSENGDEGSQNTNRATSPLSKLTKSLKPSGNGKSSNENAAIDADRLALERDLSNLLGLKVAIDHRANGGKISIHYDTLDQLDAVITRLND